MLMGVTAAALLAWLGASVRAEEANEIELSAFAEKVYQAWRAGEPMPQLSVVYPKAALADGYAVQKLFMAKALEGDAIGGYKAAVVGAAGQANLGTDGPITGVVPGSGLLSAVDGVVIDLADDPNWHIETEIGYRFGKTIAAPLKDVAALRPCVKAVLPIIEVPGGLTENTQPGTAADLAAWNVSAKRLILGKEQAPGSVDPDAVAIRLAHNGEVVNTAEGAQAAGGQWATLLKTVNDLTGRGYTIRPGHVITNGALGKILKAEAGEYRADYGNLGVIAFEVRDSGKSADE